MADSRISLINTKQPSVLQDEIFQLKQESLDYYFCRPYPRWAFGPQQWSLSKGPTPTPLPIGQILIDEAANFLTRNGAPTFTIPTDERAEEKLNAVLLSNHFQRDLHSLAIDAAHGGAVALKFSVDLNDRRRPIRINRLQIPDQVRFWFDPHDRDHVLLARLQYPYRDSLTGRWMLFREEWTDSEHATYLPLDAGYDGDRMSEIPDYDTTLGDSNNWVIDEIKPNPFGVIPITLVRNKVIDGNPLGLGDLWSGFRLIDRIALTLHGEDLYNQRLAIPTMAVINGTLLNDSPLLPGEVLQINGVTDDSDASNPKLIPASVQLLEPDGSSREYTHRDLDKWEELLYASAGLSRVDGDSIHNKGNMSLLSFHMAYERSIATTDLKRQNMGSAFSEFCQNLLLGLRNMGGIKEMANLDDDITVEVAWPPYFEQTAEDLDVITNRTIKQLNAGLLTRDRAATRIAQAEKLPSKEIEELVSELESQPEQSEDNEAVEPDSTL